MFSEISQFFFLRQILYDYTYMRYLVVVVVVVVVELLSDVQLLQPHGL